MRMKLVVIGAGGFGREVLDVVQAIQLEASSEIELLGVVDDALNELNRERLESRGISYLGKISDVFDGTATAEIRFAIGIGSPLVKQKIDSLLTAQGYEAATLIHPQASIGSEFTAAPGVVVCSGARLTTNISLGRHVHININATIGHDVSIGDYCSVNPLAAVSGDVEVESGVLIGATAFVIQGVSIGQNAVVGASSCVVRSVNSGETVKGVPAKP